VKPLQTVPRAALAGGLDPGPQRLEMLFRRSQDGDRAARETLVRQFLPLARKLARRYARSSEPYEDLVQVASLALLKAIDRFDPDRGVSFPTFAIPTILGELRRYFRDSTWSVRVSRSAKESALAVADATGRLTDLHGRPPTVQQLATYLELSIEEVLDGLFARRAYHAQSLDESAPTEEDSGCTVGDMLGAEDESYALIEARMVVADALNSLPERERHILHMRFVEDMTQSDIAERIGVSQMQISRVLQHSLEHLGELSGATGRSSPASVETRIAPSPEA
jgi:RNA polymerase sigma-B factor